MERNELKGVLEFYYHKNIIIHIDTNDDKFYNGFISSINSLDKNLLILDDRKLGEVAIHIDNIKNLEKFKEKKE